jgi:hypothetical protein
MDDATFLTKHAMTTGIAGLIVRPRHLQARADDTTERKQRVVDVKTLLAKPGTSSILDPETAALCGDDIDSEEGAERLRATAIATCIDIPWTRDALADADVQQQILEATWSEGAFADALSAPYIRIARGDDEALDLNIELARRTAQAARIEGKPACAFIEVNIGAITTGWLAGAPRRYRNAGVNVVVLRIVRFREDASLRHMRACLAFVRELRDAGLDVICDQVGRVGPVFVAGTGCAFSTGSWHFRTVTNQLVPKKGGGGGSRAIPYELPDHWRDASASLARSLDGARCPVDDCDALATESPGALRAHFLHTLVRAAEVAAAADGLERTIASLRAAQGEPQTAWAIALSEAQSETG